LLLLQEHIQGPFCKNGFWVFFVLEFPSILYKFIFCVWVRMVFGFFFCCWASINFWVHVLCVGMVFGSSWFKLQPILCWVVWVFFILYL
jgi:hypothetical protein